jgi:Holin of 3TMs, for gene-transfer release
MFGLDDIIGAGLQIINKFIPDPAAKAAAAYQMAQLQQQSEFKELDAQIQELQSQTDTDKAEATNASVFVAGWRPFIGWICGAGCGWNWIGLPIASFVATAVGHPVTVAPADISQMLPLLMGMLGLGAMRTVEKLNGVSNGQ